MENKKIDTNVIIPRRSVILYHIMRRSRYGAAECDIAFFIHRLVKMEYSAREE